MKRTLGIAAVAAIMAGNAVPARADAGDILVPVVAALIAQRLGMGVGIGIGVPVAYRPVYYGARMAYYGPPPMLASYTAPSIDVVEIARLRQMGYGWVEISRMLGVPVFMLRQAYMHGYGIGGGGLAYGYGYPSFSTYRAEPFYTGYSYPTERVYTSYSRPTVVTGGYISRYRSSNYASSQWRALRMAGATYDEAVRAETIAAQTGTRPIDVFRSYQITGRWNTIIRGVNRSVVVGGAYAPTYDSYMAYTSYPAYDYSAYTYPTYGNYGVYEDYGYSPSFAAMWYPAPTAYVSLWNTQPTYSAYYPSTYVSYYPRSYSSYYYAANVYPYLGMRRPVLSWDRNVIYTRPTVVDLNRYSRTYILAQNNRPWGVRAERVADWQGYHPRQVWEAQRKLSLTKGHAYNPLILSSFPNRTVRTTAIDTHKLDLYRRTVRTGDVKNRLTIRQTPTQTTRKRQIWDDGHLTYRRIAKLHKNSPDVVRTYTKQNGKRVQTFTKDGRKVDITRRTTWQNGIRTRTMTLTNPAQTIHRRQVWNNGKLTYRQISHDFKKHGDITRTYAVQNGRSIRTVRRDGSHFDVSKRTVLNGDRKVRWTTVRGPERTFVKRQVWNDNHLVSRRTFQQPRAMRQPRFDFNRQPQFGRAPRQAGQRVNFGGPRFGFDGGQRARFGGGRRR